MSGQPWPDATATTLAKTVSGIGFDGIELPVRPGFPVTPTNVTSELPEWLHAFSDAGLAIVSVAGNPDPRLVDACAAANVPLIRVMAPLEGQDYQAAIERLEQRFMSWVPLCEEAGVRIAVQQHHGRFISTVAGLTAFLAKLPAEWVGAAWDPGHSALAGEDADLSVSQLADRLSMVNLRNAYYTRTPGPDSAQPAWTTRWVTGNEGMSDWGSVTSSLRAIDYGGPICLAATYTDPGPGIAQLIRADLELAKHLFEQ
ncbi:MAG: sugar phosphate isomerase/epimerase family protein [Acidimicrobiales bacterium]